MLRYPRSDLPLAGSYPVATRSGRVTAFQAVPALCHGLAVRALRPCGPRAGLKTGGP